MFVGAGSLCTSIVSGALSAGLTTRLVVCGRSSESCEARLAHLRAAHGVETRSGDDETRAALLHADTELVVLCVKPYQVAAVAALLRGAPIGDRAAVLSCCAGVTTAALQSLFATDRVARCMPNTAAVVGASATAWFAAPAALAAVHVGAVERLLSAFGTHLRVAAERQIDVATALAGSGTAFVLLYIEAQVDAGVQLGLTLEQSRALVVQTFLGTAQLATDHASTHLAALRSQVVSPGGTTAAGLRQLERAAVRAGIADAINATFERATELGASEKTK